MAITSRPGSVRRDADGMRIEFERHLGAAPDLVWAALTESALTGRWFGTWTGDPATGTVELTMVAEDDDSIQTVTILECTPPSVLSLEVPGPDGTWPLSVRLSPAGTDPGTALVFTHRLAEPYDATSIGPGWHYYLDRLEAVVDGRPVPEEFDPYLELSDAYGLPD